MAEEFVEACRVLWDSWADDAFTADKKAGAFVRPGSLQVPAFKGKYFTVEGGLNVPRSPQGHPVLIQAGSSGPGQALASRIADVVFTAQNDHTEAQAFYRVVKAQVEGFGRSADEVLVMNGPEIERLIQLLGRLPGLGPRSARRVALHLLKKRETLMQPLGTALADAARAIRACSPCGNLDTIDPCSICADPNRDQGLICVVEDVGDLWAMHPPFGFALFYLRSVAPKEVKSSDIYWGSIPWVLLQLIML